MTPEEKLLKAVFGQQNIAANDDCLYEEVPERFKQQLENELNYHPLFIAYNFDGDDMNFEMEHAAVQEANRWQHTWKQSGDWFDFEYMFYGH